MAKRGKTFEELVHVLSKCLHKNAEIILDDKLLDKITGRKRQIDISIRLNDGPTKFLAIVEARDRSRPVGIEYIEQIKTKRDSVGANKAIVVSNKGFYETALTKAEAFSIDTYTLKEALNGEISDTFKFLTHITQRSIGGHIQIFALDDDGKIIKPSESIINDIKTHGLNCLLLENEKGEKVVPGKVLVNHLYEKFNINDLVDSDPEKKHPVKVIINVNSSQNLYFRNENGQRVKFTKYALVGEVWRDEKKRKTKITQYKDEKTGDVYAEVLGFEEPSETDFEVIIENPNTDRDRQIYIRPKFSQSHKQN